MITPGRRDGVHEVRAAADIVRVVSEHTSLTRAGTRLRGLCPFHQEKTPSFHVNPDSQLFHCFGCGVGGDVFNFVMQIEKVEFREALQLLAQRFGVQLEPAAGGHGGRAGRLIEAHVRAAAVYRQALAGPGGAAARAYLAQRELGGETIETLAVGWAPGRDVLKQALRRDGFPEELLLEAGLIALDAGGRGTRDRFYERVMFPIEALGGGVIAFGGRTLGDAQPKYLNSAESPIFSKGKHLYGLSRSRDAVRAAGEIILVEGYLDFAALWQAGVRNVAAVLGTGFTADHARLLKRFTERAILCFDPDRAGQAAADRSIGVLLDEGFELRVLALPDGQDPDLFVRRQGAEAVRARAAAAAPFFDFIIARAIEGRDTAQPEVRARVASAVLPVLATVGNALVRAAALARLAERLGLAEEALRLELRRIAPAARAAREQRPAPAREAERRPPPVAERRLLRLLLDDVEACSRFLAARTEEDFSGLALERLFHCLLAQHRAGHAISIAALQPLLEPAATRQLLEVALADAPRGDAREVEDCWQVLERSGLERERRRLKSDLSSAQEEGDGERVDALLRRQTELDRRIHALS